MRKENGRDGNWDRRSGGTQRGKIALESAPRACSTDILLKVKG